MSGDALIRLRGVTRAYRSGGRSVTALEGADLSVAAGEVVAVHGPSGSGKSTLLNLVAGWDRPTGGTIERHPATEVGWGGTAIVPQGIGLVAELTVAENVQLAVSDGSATASSALADVALDPDELASRFPDELSLGQQQRVAVARAAVARPRLVVADEPTAHQDEVNAGVVFDVLRGLAASGAGVLVSTHDVRLLDRVDRTIELVDGRVSG